MSVPNIDSLSERADCLANEAHVQQAVLKLAQSINDFYQGEEVTALCVLNGGIVITGMLLPHLSMPLKLDYIHVTRYGDKLQGEQLQWLAEPRSELNNRHLLLLDDIFDEGKTLSSLQSYLLNENKPASVKSAVLANKLHQRKAPDFKPDFIGLDVPDRYVFGMGMDRRGHLRNAPGIFALKGE